MKKVLFVLCMGLLAFTLTGKDVKLPLVKNGKAAWQIFYAPNEKFAAEELAYILGKMTKVKFAIQPLAQKKGSQPSFIIGQTPQAKKAGANFQKFAPDEWFVKKVGKDIILSGGNHRGSLYAVYRLMEKYGKVSFPSWDVEVIPSQKSLTIPEKLFFNKRPAFKIRTIYDGVTYGNRRFKKEIIAKKQLFNIRNGETATAGTNQFDTTKQYYYTHNFYMFVDPRKYFKSHPEYFSMNEKGKRFIGKTLYSESQLCLTNPAVTKITIDKMLEFIRKDRKKFPNGNHPTVYRLAQLDSSSFFCKCAPCMKINKKEGGDTALLLLYINAVQKAVEKVYPDVRILTSFYVSTERPAKTVRPYKNVMAEWIDLYSYSDCYRPLTSRFNKDRKEQFLAWSKLIAKGNMGIWDYHNMRDTVNTPNLETVIDAMPADLQFFHKNGVSRYFTEMEDGAAYYGASQIFLDLQYYLGRQLMIDPYQDSEKLVTHYMKACYGPSAGSMTKILNIIREALKKEPVGLYNTVKVRGYQTNAFIRKVLPLWQKAMKETRSDSNYRRYVEQDGLIILAAALNKTGLVKGQERKEMTDLFRKLAQKRIRFFLAPKQQKITLQALEKKIKAFDNAQIVLPVPALFKNVPAGKIRVFGYPHFRQMIYSPKKPQPYIVDDPSSPIGKAVTPPPGSTPSYEKYVPHSFGVYDYGTKTSMERAFKKLPRDEKYHWFYVGRADVKPASFFWAFRWVLQADFTGVWQLSDGVKDGNKWHVYVSAKHTGPVYVKGSKSPNKLFIDYVVITRDKMKLPK